ncbi:MAG: hypothetical protein ACRC33_07865 [Gemmataceae bacterium]
MSRRWLVAGLGLAAAAGVLVWVSSSSAQRDGGMPGRMGPPGRFICAFGSPAQVVVLDTATGQVYAINQRDFKSADDLARMRDVPARPVERLRDGDRPREGDRRPKERDEERLKDAPLKDAPRKDGVRPKEREEPKKDR